MIVRVTSVSPVQGGAKVMFDVGGQPIEATVVDSSLHGEGVVPTISVEEREVCKVLAMCGLWKPFGQDYFAFRKGRGREFPWDYGDRLLT